MDSQTLNILLVIFVTATVTISLRALPFLLFADEKKCPAVITYIGKVLSPAAIAMLAVYCLLAVYREQSFADGGFGIPELTAGAVVVLLHWWKRNPLLSIICGTALYMLIVQNFF
ncbi:MAG: AzlD domain-containing protein [Lentisphaeria bacterium]|nr:AzlD domain-containing protein [Lentisphaeria bacterium]